MRVKICGITQGEQGRTIAELGATDLGLICVPRSPRYLRPDQVRAILEELPPRVGKIGVFVNGSLGEMAEYVAAGLTGLQLHGDETPTFCQEVRARWPGLEIIKAFRVNALEVLTKTKLYDRYVDTFLLDAYHPQQYGGTGKTIDWSLLKGFKPGCPWFLAGGLTPENIVEALAALEPSGVDISSGVERSPGDKDLGKVARLFKQLSGLKTPIADCPPRTTLTGERVAQGCSN